MTSLIIYSEFYSSSPNYGSSCVPVHFAVDFRDRGKRIRASGSNSDHPFWDGLGTFDLHDVAPYRLLFEQRKIARAMLFGNFQFEVEFATFFNLELQSLCAESRSSPARTGAGWRRHDWRHDWRYDWRYDWRNGIRK